jgi:hypothetical protein
MAGYAQSALGRRTASSSLSDVHCHVISRKLLYTGATTSNLGRATLRSAYPKL